MRFITLLVATCVTAVYSIPLLGALDVLPSPDSSVPTPGVLLANPFQVPADQTPDSGQPGSSGNQVLPATDTEAVTGANLDINADPNNPVIQVATSGVIPLDANVNVVDTPNTAQLNLGTSLNQPTDLSPSSNIYDESKTDLASSAGDVPKAESNPETACVDSTSDTAPKVRRGVVSDLSNGFFHILDGIKNFHLLPDSCPSGLDTSGSRQPKNSPQRPTNPADRQPGQSIGTQNPSRKPGYPKSMNDQWYYPWISGAPGLGGGGSCNGMFSNTDKVWTLVCHGPPEPLGLRAGVANVVHNCQRCTCVS